MKQWFATFAVVLLALAGASASTITDNFESYALGAFPSPTWLDVGTLLPSPGTPIPSATVVSTTDAFGHPTQALSIANALASSRGIYATVPLSSTYSLAADIRVDQYSDHPSGPLNDWAMQLGFEQVGPYNMCCNSQAGIYASSLTGGWRLFVGSNGPGGDIDFGVPATVGTWYRVQLNLDLPTATFHSVIIDVATGNVLVNRFDTFTGLNTSNTQFDSITFFGGELSSSDTIANLAVVDNVTIGTTPEPSTFLLIGSGLSLLASRLRRR